MKPHQLLPGDTIKPQSGEPEVVRSVFVVVQLANGTDERYSPDDDILVVPQPERPEDEPREAHETAVQMADDLPHPPVPKLPTVTPEPATEPTDAV